MIITCRSVPSYHRTWSGASSLVYTGLHMLSIPIPVPDSNLGTSSIVMFTASAYSNAPMVKIKAPHNMLGLRP